MASTTIPFQPASSIKALLDQIYDVKFSKHTPLIVALLSMIYTVYRTQHYLASVFQIDPLVRWPTSVFIELLVLGSAAATFMAHASRPCRTGRTRSAGTTKERPASAPAWLPGAQPMSWQLGSAESRWEIT